MAYLTVGQRSQRMLRLLMGAANPRILAALAGYGFTKDELDEGWELLRAVADEKLAMVAPEPAPDTSLVKQLDAWENKWFVVGNASLTRHHPAVHEQVFLNISRQSNANVVFSVTTFVSRVEALAHGTAEDQAARALLAKRGLTDAVLDEAKDILAKIAGEGVIAQSPPDPAKKKEAEKAMWSWYREWSTIARSEIKDRRLLLSLGFLRSNKKRKGDDAEDEALEDEIDDDTADDDAFEDDIVPVPV